MQRLLAALSSFILVFVMFFVSPGFGRTPVASYIVVNAANGSILAESKAITTTYPASLTKVMTLLILFERLEQGKIKLQQNFLVSRHAASMPATKIGLKRGGKITVEDAIEALIVHSANDVAVVIAENIAGSEANFVQLMNAKAKQIGLTQTTFGNSSGLPHFRQVTTANDMAKLALTVLREYPEYYQYFATKSFKHNNQSFLNHNTLLQRYDGADGMKTGYIRASGYNLITSAKQGANRLIVVIMGAKSATQRHQQMVKLLNTGFTKLKNPSANTGRFLITPLPKNHVTHLPKPAPLKPSMKQLLLASSRSVAGDWGIQIGAFSSSQIAQEKLQKASKILGSAMRGQPIIQDYKPATGKTLYRARLLGLSRQDAVAACKALAKSSIDCFILNHPSTNSQSAFNPN